MFFMDRNFCDTVSLSGNGFIVAYIPAGTLALIICCKVLVVKIIFK